MNNQEQEEFKQSEKSLDMFPDYEDIVKKEWNDMPEYSHKNKEAIKQLIVSFKNFEDYRKFAALINQPITAKTKSIWFPKIENTSMVDKRYASEL